MSNIHENVKLGRLTLSSYNKGKKSTKKGVSRAWLLLC